MRRPTRMLGAGLSWSIVGLMAAGCSAGTPAAPVQRIQAAAIPASAPDAKPGVAANSVAAAAPSTASDAPSRTSVVTQAAAEIPGEPRREVEVAQAGTNPAAVAAKPFEFAADAAGKLAAERLPPPKQLPIPNVPWVQEARPAPARSPDAISAALSPLPQAPSTAESRVLPVEQTAIARLLPTLDRPPLPMLPASLAPAAVEYPPAPRTRIASRPVSATLDLSVTRLPFDPKPTPQDDPSSVLANRQLLALLPTTAPVPAPPERLSIPDPFEHLRVVAVKTPPAESIAPSASRERPAAVVFEVAP